jgi:hypothetical protein
MSEVFISYARSTEAQAQSIAEGLRALGYGVSRRRFGGSRDQQLHWNDYRAAIVHKGSPHLFSDRPPSGLG